MLQALKLENTPTPAKTRSGSGSDPQDSAFAGLMAQASFAPMAQASSDPAIPREDLRSSRELATQHPEASDARSLAKSKDRPSSETSPVEAPSDSDDPVKTAATAVGEGEAETPSPDPEAAPKQVTDPAASQAAAKIQIEANVAPILPTGPAGPGTQIPQPASGTPTVTAEAQTAKAAVQTPKPEIKGAEAVPRPDAALKGLSQEFQTSEKEATSPVKPALTELLYLPKGDIQTPKLNPESGKTLPADAPKLAITSQTETTADSKSGTNLPGGELNQAKPSQPSPGIEEGRLLRPETFSQQLQNPKHPVASVEAATVAMAEGVKASQATAHVESPAAVRPSPVFTQVEGSIRWILQNKVQGAELQLHPESLGRMVIQLRVEGQEVHARLWASEPTSLAILQNHKAFLESSLREQGLSLGSFDLQSGARGDGAQSAPQERAPMGVPSPLPTSEIKQEMPIGADLDLANTHRIEVFA